MTIKIEIDEKYISELVSQEIAKRIVAEHGYEKHNIGEWKLVEADGELFQLTSTKYDFLRMAHHLFHTTGEKP